MAVWEYKIISSGKGGFATPALLESFLNQLGAEQWEIVEFRTQPDNPLAFAGLARRPTQRDWTLEDAAAAAARAEADKLRAEFEAKFRGSAPAATPSAPAEEAPAADDGLRRLRDTEHDLDPDAPDEEGGEEDWDKIGTEEELPTFFEALRPHLRRNQRGPGMSVGVDFLAKKWDMSDDDVLGALKECGLEIPNDEDAKLVYTEYDGDLFWVNMNRRGELWINTKEKPRPVFRTVQATRVAVEEAPKAEGGEAAEAAPGAEASKASERTGSHERSDRHDRQGRHGSPRQDGPPEPLPEGVQLLEKIRPLMRRNRHGSGGSGSTSFLSRALRCGESDLSTGFAALGLVAPEAPGDKPAFVEIGDHLWWVNKDSRGALWINTREKREAEASADAGQSHQPEAGAGSAPSSAAPDESAPRTEGAAPASASSMPPEAPSPQTQDHVPQSAESAPGHVLAAVRLLLKETRTGAVAAPVGRLSEELSKSQEDLLAALVGSGLAIPEKAREKPVFVEHAGEIFWINRNARDELWLNAKPSKFADGQDTGPEGEKGQRRPKKKKETTES